MCKAELPLELVTRLQELTGPLDPNPASVIERLLELHARSRLAQGYPSRGATTPVATRAADMRISQMVGGRSPRERGISVSVQHQQIQAVSVSDLYEQVLRLVLANGESALRLKRVTPLKTSAQRYLIALKPEHPTGRPFVVPVHHGDYYMEAHKDYKNALRHLGKLLSRLGLSFSS